MRARMKRRIREGVRKVGSDQPIGIGKAFSGREVGPVVDDRDLEAQERPDMGDGLGHVPGADDDQLLNRPSHFEVELDALAVDVDLTQPVS
jgi:hypothetical protein